MILLAVEEARLQIFEYSPRSVKSAVVGYGGAEKDQVAKMVRVLLPGCAMVKMSEVAPATGELLQRLVAERFSPDLLAVVTGGMGGLGESITTKMADAGYRVVVTYSPSNTKYKAWLEEMKGRGYSFAAFPIDEVFSSLRDRLKR